MNQTLKKFLPAAVTSVFLCLPSALIAHGNDPYSSAQYWGFYLDSCHNVDKDAVIVQQQLDEKSPEISYGDIKFDINRMSTSIPKLSKKSIKKTEFHTCQIKLKHAKNLIAEAKIHEKELEKARQKVARQRHMNSPLYKKALELGFQDYGWLGALSDDYKQFGEKRLEHWIIYIDYDCGKYFRAIQYLKPYVIYAAVNGGYHTCSYRGPIAVLPISGTKIDRGKLIDRNSYYIYEGVIKTEDSDGFPIKVPVLKQEKFKPKVPNK